MSSRSCGWTKMSAGPPMRSDVWKLSGSLNRTSPRISPSIGASFCLRPGLEATEQFGTELRDVAGAQRDDQVPGTADVDDVLDDARPVLAEVRHVAVTVGADRVGQLRGADPLDGGLAGRVDVHHHQD